MTYTPKVTKEKRMQILEGTTHCHKCYREKVNGKCPACGNRKKEVIIKDDNLLAERMESYFRLCDEKKEIASMTGLALYLGVKREYLVNGYKSDKRSKKFKLLYERARDNVIARVEKRALEGKTPAAFAIFWLTNNGGFWVNERYQKNEVTIGTDTAIKRIADRLANENKKPKTLEEPKELLQLKRDIIEGELVETQKQEP